MAYRSSTQNHGSSSTPGTTVPSGIAANDIILLQVGFGDNVDISAYMPSGFAALSNPTGSGNWVGDGAFFSCWKRATGSESGSFTFSAVGFARDWTVLCSLYSGRDTTNPPVVSTWSNSNVSNLSVVSIASGGVTAQTGDDLVWTTSMDWADIQVVVTWGPPSGYTESQAFSTAADYTAPMESSYKNAVTAGATGGVTGTATFAGLSHARWGAELVRIPVAGGAASTAGVHRMALGCG